MEELISYSSGCFIAISLVILLVGLMIISSQKEIKDKLDELIKFKDER